MAVQSSSRQRPNKNSSGRHPSSPKAPKRKRGNWFIPVLGLTTLALLSAIAGALLAVSMASVPLAQSKLTPKQAAVFSKEKTISYQNLNLPQLSRPINILVLGTKVLTADVGQGNQGKGYLPLVNSLEGLTDTLMLIRLDPEQQKLTLMSIPRDTQVEIPGHGLRKINEANADGGPALAAQTVENLLGNVPIDRYVRVNVQAVEKLIDALGGVTVYVPKRMKYQDDSQHLYINLQEGEQHLDGDKTLQLLRFRKDRLGDIGRIQRQQMVTRALIEQSLKPQTILKIPEILSILQAYIDTNLNMEELVAIAGFAAQTNRSNVQMLMLPGDFSGNGRRAVSYWLPNHEKIQTLMGRYFGSNNAEHSEENDGLAMANNFNPMANGTDGDVNRGERNRADTVEENSSVASATGETGADPNAFNDGDASNTTDSELASTQTNSVMITSADLPNPAEPQDFKQLRIAIQDSTNNPTAISHLVHYLQDAGYSHINIVENWQQPLKMTRIIAPHGDREGATELQTQLGLGEVLIDSNGYLVSDLTIQVGQDWVQRSPSRRRSY